jgi:hypothetical protein
LMLKDCQNHSLLLLVSVSRIAEIDGLTPTPSTQFSI